MEATAIKTESTLALRRARARLRAWKARVLEAQGVRQELEPKARSTLDPFLQELADRCERAENDVLRLGQIEAAWRHARDAAARSLGELEAAWQSVANPRRLQAACAPLGPGGKSG